MSRQRNRDDRLAAFLQASQAMASSLDLDQVLRTVVEAAAAISGAPFVRLFLLEGAPPMLHWRVGVGLSPEGEPNRPIRIGESFSGQVAVTGQPLAVADCREDPRLRFPEHIQRYSLISYLGLPVKTGDRLLGVLCFNTNAPHVYTEEEISFLNAFAQQAAVAIQNAQLHREEQRRRQQLEAVRAVAAEITRELDLTLLLQLIIRRAVDLTGAQAGSLSLWDEGAQILRHRAWVGYDDWLANVTLRPGEGVKGAVAQRRAGMIVNDYPASPVAYPPFVERLGTTAVLAEPLLYQNRLLGVVSVDMREPGRRFSGEDRKVLALFADQAAVAIENARLHEATQQELADRIRAEEGLRHSEEQARRLAQENATMAELGRLISSTPNIEDVYENFAAEVRKILPFDRIVINHIDAEKNIVRNLFIAGEALPGRTTSDPYPLEGSSNVEMIRTRASLLIQTDDFGPYTARFPGLVSTFKAGFRSILNVPLFAKGQVIGGLLLRSRQPNAYTDGDVRLAERIASQIAGAVTNAQLYLENVHLYEAAQREIAERRQAEEILAVRTRHLEAIRSISEEITRELDLAVVLDLIVQRAVVLVGATFRQYPALGRRAATAHSSGVDGERQARAYGSPAARRRGGGGRRPAAPRAHRQ